ncbi:MAG: MerC domain-containing protein [Parasphingorhabdus sp.]|nr:MerC domain-containing protein [Parasphingorhabdus sp.]
MDRAQDILERQAFWDRAAITLSGLCMVHCVATTGILLALSSAGGILFAPIIHEIGLAFAILLGAIALGQGARHHRRKLPLLTGMFGLLFMGLALVLGHGLHEAALTILGVGLLGAAHYANSRACAQVTPQ